MKKHENIGRRFFNLTMTIFAKTVMGISKGMLQLVRTITGTKDKKQFAH
ncbi:hypothetical protein CYPRO_3059 [Cyclonatronum proteinivorum]|uniref:Uncharacterized protein n=1 Tax=Cyclonatronum proteinivorum TaxID=1457365 RepID=A0A345UP93_9BACT|nr:hypothetical protein [Cyclonatronum proteinivorum]AXJ02295.1 hypothetical protein CYPRO_3059 [Cyclonatronum proteinivorum]